MCLVPVWALTFTFHNTPATTQYLSERRNYEFCTGNCIGFVQKGFGEKTKFGIIICHRFRPTDTATVLQFSIK